MVMKTTMMPIAMFISIFNAMPIAMFIPMFMFIAMFIPMPIAMFIAMLAYRTLRLLLHSEITERRLE